MAKDKSILLRLDNEQLEKLEALKKHLVRPNRNNTIEFLIDEAFKSNKLKLK